MNPPPQMKAVPLTITSINYRVTLPRSQPGTLHLEPVFAIPLLDFLFFFLFCIYVYFYKAYIFFPVFSMHIDNSLSKQNWNHTTWSFFWVLIKKILSLEHIPFSLKSLWKYKTQCLHNIPYFGWTVIYS